MTIGKAQIEEIALWCASDDSISSLREDVLRDFPRGRRSDYWAGLGESNQVFRRCLGWFMFTRHEGHNKTPSERAAAALYPGPRGEAIAEAVRGARFVLAVTRSVLPGRAVFLEIRRERFEIPDRSWSRIMTPGSAVAAHLVPIGREGAWLPGPGWLELPFRFGPNIRRDLDRFQLNPMQLELMLQKRAREPHPEAHQATSFREAVARMTRLAEENGRRGLVMAEEDWRVMVERHMSVMDTNGFYDFVLREARETDLERINVWLAHASDIWNNTPQPDHGGRSAREMAEELYGPADRSRVPGPVPSRGPRRHRVPR